MFKQAIVALGTATEGLLQPYYLLSGLLQLLMLSGVEDERHGVGLVWLYLYVVGGGLHVLVEVLVIIVLPGNYRRDPDLAHDVSVYGVKRAVEVGVS